MERREFIATGAIAATGFTLLPSGILFAKAKDKVRLGYIGVGDRGMSHISEGTLRDDVEIVAVCDIQERSLKRCREFIAARVHIPRQRPRYAGPGYEYALTRALTCALAWQ